MKNIAFALSLFLALPAMAKEQGQTVAIDLESSVLKWTGRKVTGMHNGTIKLKSGQIQLAKGAVSGGEFEIDMNSLANEDIPEGKTREKLVGHLKSDDFFSVEKHPTAKFIITKVKAFPKAKPDGSTHNVSGKLTIKGITHPVAFPAAIKIGDGKAEAKGTVSLDRTKWNVRYGSKKFIKDIGDKAIHDNFDVELNLVGKI